MKNILAIATLISVSLFTMMSFANPANLEGRVIAVCNRIIDTNVNQSADDTLLSAGAVTLVKYDSGYKVVYNWENLRFQGHGSISALDTGCVMNEASSVTYSQCAENDQTLRMKQSFYGAPAPRIYGVFNKNTLQLRVTYKERNFLFYKTMSDVVFQCSNP